MKAMVLFSLISLWSISSLAQDALWAKQTVSSTYSNRSIDIDDDENIYTCGSFSGIVEFDPSLGTIISDGDIYVQKNDSLGNFEWVTILGADDDFSAPQDDIQDILVDGVGNSYVSGTYVDTTQAWATHIYVVKLDSDGNIEWEHTLGSGGGGEMSFAHDGNILITGWFNDTTDFDQHPVNQTELYPGNGSAFLLKLDINGNLVWVKQYGVTENYEGGMTYQQIVTDDLGMIYLGGGFIDTIDLDPGLSVQQFTAPAQVNAWDNDMYILKLDSDGNYVWAHHFDGVENDGIGDIIVAGNNLFIQGHVGDEVDVDPDVVDEFLINGTWGRSGFILSLSPDGEYQWVNLYDAYMQVLDTDNNGDIYSYGWLDGSCDFSQTTTPNIVTPVTSKNLYLLHLDSLGEFQSVVNYDDQAEASARPSMRRTNDGDFYIAGIHTGSLFGLLPSGVDKTFIAKLGTLPQNSVGELSSHDFVLYPNPGDSHLTIESAMKIEKLEVLDSKGSLLFEEHGNHINIGNLESGVYLIRVHSTNRVFTRRFVKR